MLAAFGMFVFVHTFPGGYRPSPQITLEKTTENGIETPVVVRLEKEIIKGEKGAKDSEKVVRVIVESGQIEVTNVPLPLESGKAPFVDGKTVVGHTAVELPPTVFDEKKQTIIAEADAQDPWLKVRVLARDVVSADSKEPLKFGVEAVAVVLQPGVKVVAHDVLQHFSSKFNREYSKFIARSEKAKPFAVYAYSYLWTFLISAIVAIGVSFFTTRKPEAELKDLVMGLAKMPDQTPCRWYQKPTLWSIIVTVALIVLNIIFW
jgi:hypothetical protein